MTGIESLSHIAMEQHTKDRDLKRSNTNSGAFISEEPTIL